MPKVVDKVKFETSNKGGRESNTWRVLTDDGYELLYAVKPLSKDLDVLTTVHTKSGAGERVNYAGFNDPMASTPVKIISQNEKNIKNGEEKVKLYHGSDAKFDKFDRVGDKITSLGYGHYFSPSVEEAKKYGKNIKEISINKKDILDLDHPTKTQRKEIVSELEKVVPKDKIAGYGKVNKIDITDMPDNEALKLFYQKQEDTKNLWHDRAKAQIVEDGDKAYIQWMDSGLENASPANLKNLIQEYNQDIPKKLGYKVAKNGSEVAVYDIKLVNDSLHVEPKDDVVWGGDTLSSTSTPQTVDKTMLDTVEHIVPKNEKNIKNGEVNPNILQTAPSATLGAVGAGVTFDFF
jgi:hypothetical protein